MRLSVGSVNASGRREPTGRAYRDDGCMLIAIVDFTTTAADQPAALAQLDAERQQVRAMPGNIAFRVYASREAEPGITIVHEWADETAFARYAESDSFARSGAVLRPMMTGTPVSRRFRAELLETVR